MTAAERAELLTALAHALAEISAAELVTMLTARLERLDARILSPRSAP